jgi:hypothetical protein
MPAILPINAHIGNSLNSRYNDLDMVKSTTPYKPSKFSRYIIYPLGFVLFVFILGILLLLANGFRFEFKRGRLLMEKTGMIILSTRPSDASVFIDNKDTNQKTGFTFLPISIKDLLPGKTLVTVKKSGYRDWTRETEIKPNLVSWLNYIILFPNDLKIKKVEDLSGKKVIAQSKNKRYLFVSDSGGKNLYTYDETNGNAVKIWPKSYTPTEEWLRQPAINSAEFDSNSDRLVLNVKNGDKNDYAILDTAPDGKISSLSSYKLNIQKILWDQNNSNLLYALADSSLYRIDLGSQNTTLLTKNIADFSVERNQKLYLIVLLDDGTRALEQSDLDGSRRETLAKAVVKDSSYKISYSPKVDAVAVLPVTEKTLTVYYRLNNQPSTLQLEKNISDFKWSTNGKMIYYYDSNTVKRFDWDNGKEVSTKIDGIRNVDWYFDDFHYIVQTGNTLIEMDYDGVNRVTLSDKAVEYYFLDPRLSNLFYANKNADTLEYYKYSSSL